MAKHTAWNGGNGADFDGCPRCAAGGQAGLRSESPPKDVITPLPLGPGLGVEVDEDKVNRLLTPLSFPELR